MTIDEKLVLLKAAIEDGANIQFTFFVSDGIKAHDLSSVYSLYYGLSESTHEHNEKTKVVRLETDHKNKIEGKIFYV